RLVSDWSSDVCSSDLTTVDNTPVPLLGLSLTDGASAAQHNARHMQVLSRLDAFSMKLPIATPPNPAVDPFTANQPDAPGGSLGRSEERRVGKECRSR